MLHYEILDKKRVEIIPLFRPFKKDFYLAGDTGLALQIGHRDSLDFDFFSQKAFDPGKLFLTLKDIFEGFKLIKVQEEKDTLSVILEDSIKISFFTYNYGLVKRPIKEDYFNLASLEDIGCMKLSAVVSRATNKDYIDLYFILKRIPLAVLLKEAGKKFPELDQNLILKSLVYFKDIGKNPIRFRNNNKVGFSEVKNFIKKSVLDFLK